jgi:hypothetical protein
MGPTQKPKNIQDAVREKNVAILKHLEKKIQDLRSLSYPPPIKIK